MMTGEDSKGVSFEIFKVISNTIKKEVAKSEANLGLAVSLLEVRNKCLLSITPMKEVVLTYLMPQSEYLTGENFS
jgi:hypothetical protein